MKKKKESNFLLYGLLIGGIISAGLFIFMGTRFVNNSNREYRERRHKFFEGIDDIFDESGKNILTEDIKIDKDTENGIIDELFSRNNS